MALLASSTKSLRYILTNQKATLIRETKEGTAIIMKKFLLIITLLAIACSSASAAGLKLRKDPNNYETVNGVSMRNLWLLDRFHYGATELQTDFAWCNIRARTAVIQDGIVYVAHSEAKQIVPQPGDTIMAAVIYRFDAMTGEEMAPLDVTLNGEPYGAFLGVTSIGKDNFGHVWVAPYTSEMTSEVPLYQVNIETGELTLVANLDKGDVIARTDYLDLVGDITLEQAECNVMTPGSGWQVPTVYAWHNEQGGDVDTWEGFFAGDPYMDFWEMYPASQTQWGHAPACRFVLGEDEETRYSGENFYIDGFTTVPTLYASDGTIVDGFGSLTQEEMQADSLLMPKPGTNGIGEFKLGDRKFIVYSIGQYDAPNSCQVNICELGEGMAFSGMQRYWTFPADGQGQTTDSGLRIHPITIEYTNEGVLVFEYKCFNGMGVYLVGEDVVPGQYYDFMVDGICYKINNDQNSVSVTYEVFSNPRYNNLSGDIVIPESVTYNGNTYTVTSILNTAFQYCTDITSVTIGNSVTSVGNNVFNGCNGLASVIIPNSVTSIGSGTFNGCTSLTSITLSGKGSWNYDHSQLKGLQAIINQIKTLNVGSEITSLGGFSFAPDVVNSYAAVPPVCQSSTFASYDGELHVPSASAVAYFTADYWQNFGNLSNNITEQVTLSQTEANIPQWGTLELSATTNPEGSNLVWSSTNSNIATVSDNGIVTGVSQGECDIFATLESNPAVYASCHVNVSYPEVSISLNYTELEMKYGEDTTLIATINPDNTGLTPTWASSNESVATVENGVVTAVGEGECDITATVLDQTATCHVVVDVVTISLNYTELEMKYGEDTTLVASIDPDNAGLTPTWESSDESVATVDNGVVTAVGEGECYITATVLDKTATCHVVVNDDLILSLNIDNAILGANQLITVYPTCTPDIPVELVVTSSDPSVAMARVINRTNAPEVGLMTFPMKGMALDYLEALSAPNESKTPAFASEKAIMIVGVQNGTATITVTTADGKATPAVLELRVVDVDGDRTITATDITCLYNYLLNGDETYITTSDTDGDGNITAADITVLYNLLLGN